ncbi:MAG: hypothetical protein ACPGTO_11535, partial [Polaribacter sp.]
ANIPDQTQCRNIRSCSWNAATNVCDGVVRDFDVNTHAKTTIPRNNWRCGGPETGNTQASCEAVSTTSLQTYFAPFGDTSAVSGCTWVPPVVASCVGYASGFL